MIDDRKRQTILPGLQVKQVLKFIAPKARKAPDPRTARQDALKPCSRCSPASIPSTSGCSTENRLSRRTPQTSRPGWLPAWRRSSATILATSSRALLLVMSLMKPTTRLFRLPSTYHMPIQRPRCFRTPPVECRLRIIDFSLCVLAAPVLAISESYHQPQHVRCVRSMRAGMHGAPAFGDRETQRESEGSQARGQRPRCRCELWSSAAISPLRRASTDQNPPMHLAT